jgi:hypothetical protein
MSSAIREYFEMLVERFGQGWNRFWFTPSDPFTLGVIRVLTGIMAIYMVATFGPDLGAFFGKEGLIQPRLLEDLSAGQPPYSFSYLNHLDTPAELTIAHGAGLAVLGLFTLGVATRVTSVLALVVVLSYIHRAPLVAAHFEWILAFMMFYLCLGPSGRCLSIDSLLSRRTRARSPHAPHEEAGAARNAAAGSVAATVAIRLMQVHLAAVYLMMGLAKLMGGAQGSIWWTGDAMFWLVARPESRLVDLTGLHEYVLNAWTHLVVWTEMLFPVLIWNRLARPLLLAISTLLWASLAVATGLVPFCLIMAIANLAYVPASILRSASTCCGIARSKQPAPLAAK